MSQYFAKREECSHHKIFPGVDIHTLAGQQMMLSLVEFAPRSVVERHSHPQEQMGFLLEGELEFFVGEERYVARPGDMWRIPGGVEHGGFSNQGVVNVRCQDCSALNGVRSIESQHNW